MGCGDHSKQQRYLTADKNLKDIENIIRQALINANGKSVIIILGENQLCNSQSGLIANDRRLTMSSETFPRNHSNTIQTRETQLSINSKSNILLPQEIIKQIYTEVLQKEVFKLSPNIKKQIKVDQFTRNATQSKRIQEEIKLLVQNLPIHSSNSIFVRCNEADTNHFQCLIMGSQDTPYAYGAYIYDLYCDQSFPQSPPKMKLLTTGGKQVRFNPKLYKSGSICLSLLGTQNESNSENWNQQKSHIYQILMSIQSQVMNEGVNFIKHQIQV